MTQSPDSSFPVCFGGQFTNFRPTSRGLYSFNSWANFSSAEDSSHWPAELDSNGASPEVSSSQFPFGEDFGLPESTPVRLIRSLVVFIGTWAVAEKKNPQILN